jgi:hypothetical protein
MTMAAKMPSGARCGVMIGMVAVESVPTAGGGVGRTYGEKARNQGHGGQKRSDAFTLQTHATRRHTEPRNSGLAVASVTETTRHQKVSEGGYMTVNTRHLSEFSLIVVRTGIIFAAMHKNALTDFCALHICGGQPAR